MNKWDETYWDYDYLRESQLNIAAALRHEWLSVDALSRQAKQDTKRRKLGGKTGWEQLVILGIAAVDTSDKNGISLRRGPEWDSWWKRAPTNEVQMLRHGATIEDIGL